MTSAEPELKYEEPRTLSGSIYARASNRQKLLYKFKREATRSGSKVNVLRNYTYADGKPAAREQVVYDGNNLVSFELEELQIGARGSALIRRAPGNPSKGTIGFSYTEKVGTIKPKVRTEPLRDNTLINDMVGPFLVSHWEELARGEKVRCRYLVLPRRETVGFTFVKNSESTWQGQPVLILKMEPSSRIIAALVEPLYFSIQTAPPHHVLEYIGRTTPKIETGGQWRDLDAVTVFDWK